MTAEQARKISVDARIPNMQPIYDAIRDAANQGETHVNFPVSKQLSWSISKVIAELGRLGYTIVGKDVRDKLKISWGVQIQIDPADSAMYLPADDFAP